MVSLLRKPKADVLLEVTGSPFNPGSTVDAGVTVSSMESFTVRSGIVQLSCTEVYWQIVSTGKSTYHQKRKHKLYKVEESFLGDINFALGMTTHKLVKFTIPQDLPPTVCGKKVNISWQLKASLDIIKQRDIHVKHELVVSPISIAVPVLEKDYQALTNKVTKSSDDGELTLALASQSGIGSGTLRGRFETIMKKTMNVDTIRIELEVKESAGSMSSKNIADVVILEGKTSLLGGGYRQWPFELKIPTAPPPTIKTEKSSVVWLVKGVLDKRLRKDFKVIAPIQMF
jgi:hypothetical protein